MRWWGSRTQGGQEEAAGSISEMEAQGPEGPWVSTCVGSSPAVMMKHLALLLSLQRANQQTGERK